MINLIPPDARRRITTEYWVRVITVWLFLLTVAAMLTGAFLLPPYMLVTSQVRSFVAEAEAAKALVANGDVTARALIVAGDQARLLIEAERTPRFTAIIDELLQVVDEGIVVREYYFSRTASGVAPVQLGGVAATRQTLAAFRDALLAQPAVAAVDLPISSFAKDRDIEFMLTLTIASTTSTP
jgi:hypothetical protein